jgi:hypothetical protein
MSLRKDPASLLTLFCWLVPVLVLLPYVFAYRNDRRQNPQALGGRDKNRMREILERRAAAWRLRITLGAVLVGATWASWLLWRQQYAFRFTERWSAVFAVITLIIMALTIDALVRIFRRNADGTRADTGQPVELTPPSGQAVVVAGGVETVVPAAVAAAAPAAPAAAAPAAAVVPLADQPANSLVWHRRDGIKGLVMGLDGRTSTSKVQFVLWTIVVLFVLSFLLAVANSPNCTKQVAMKRTTFDCPAMKKFNRTGFAAAVGTRFPAELLVLLGLPAGAAIVAKNVSSDNPKPQATSGDDAGVAAGLSQIVSKDTNGDLDLLDCQYFIFNLVALTYFLLQFLTKPQAGIPEVPSALLVLAGVSTGSYVAKTTLGGAQTDTDKDKTK